MRESRITLVRELADRLADLSGVESMEKFLSEASEFVDRCLVVGGLYAERARAKRQESK